MIVSLAAFIAPRLARAACTMGPDFGQLLPNCGDGYCYVVSPGYGTAASLAGAFWSLGTGKPPVGQGDDNGAWPVGGWLLPSASSFYLAGTWQASPSIDGCIAGQVAPGKPAEIMVALISDENFLTGGFFAVASARRVVGSFPEFDFTFVAGGGLAHDIDLVEIPRARIASFTRPDVWEFVAPDLGQVSVGIYGDGSVAAGEVAKGYRVYTRPHAPASYRTSAGWSPVTGIVPLGQNAVATVPWSGEIYFAYALAFDGAFETAHVGRYARAVSLCHPTDADGDGFSDVAGDPECCPDPAACDCNDADPNVHPGALEVCNGVDDDCSGTVDDVALPGSVGSLQLGKDPGATRLEWSPLAEATRYDVIRGELSTLLETGGSFAAATRTCLADDVAATHADDPEDLDPDQGFWYLLRAGNCTGVGSYDTPDASQAAPRDAGIAASGHACP